MEKHEVFEQASILAFDPDWITDPPPEYILKYLDDEAMRSLVKVHYDIRRKALERTVEILHDRLAVLRQVQEIVEGGMSR